MDGRRGVGILISLYKIVFHFEALLWKSIILVLPPSTCIAHTNAMVLHDYCAVYALPPTSRVYAIHHTILVITISCKGQHINGYGKAIFVTFACLLPPEAPGFCGNIAQDFRPAVGP